MKFIARFMIIVCLLAAAIATMWHGWWTVTAWLAAAAAWFVASQGKYES
jgi:hypothetical protein